MQIIVLLGANILHIILKALKALMIETSKQSICKKDESCQQCDFQRNRQFSKNYNSLPLRPTQFITKERHISDMSSIRKNIIEP